MDINTATAWLSAHWAQCFVGAWVFSTALAAAAHKLNMPRLAKAGELVGLTVSMLLAARAPGALGEAKAEDK